ncbi:MAG: hypothetical protein N4A72_03240 [Bacteroidales bacterium]|jgi:predicted PurR-regulated permease PerM|nr:hypothetical protein [Bacteroidales bacterium]
MNQRTVVWFIVLVVYIILLISIAYIAFWQQEFNDPDKTINGYIEQIKEIEAINGSDKLKEDMEDGIISFMSKANDSSGDLQELASQSFNIILGALLAFLSASITMFIKSDKSKD